MQDDGAVADEHVVLHLASFEVDEVADDTPVAHHGQVIVRRVQHTAVLNRREITDADTALTVAPQHRTRPDRAALADVDIADDGGLRVNECSRMDHGYSVTERVDGHPRTLSSLSRKVSTSRATEGP